MPAWSHVVSRLCAMFTRRLKPSSEVILGPHGAKSLPTAWTAWNAVLSCLILYYIVLSFEGGCGSRSVGIAPSHLNLCPRTYPVGVKHPGHILSLTSRSAQVVYRGEASWSIIVSGAYGTLPRPCQDILDKRLWKFEVDLLSRYIILVDCAVHTPHSFWVMLIEMATAMLSALETLSR